MAKRARAKLYDIQFPLTAQQIENINSNFDRLFADLHATEVSSFFTDGVLQGIHGGTDQGADPFTIGDMLYADSEETWARLASGVAGYALISGGPGAAPHWGQLLHNLLQSDTHSDTLTGTVVRGDVIIGNSTPKWSRLAKGSNGSFLRSGSTDVAWGTDGSALTNIVESAISDGTILARVAANESISGIYNFTNGATVTIASVGQIKLFNTGFSLFEIDCSASAYWAARINNSSSSGPGLRLAAGSTSAHVHVQGWDYNLTNMLWQIKGNGDTFFKGIVTANINGTATTLWARAIIAGGFGVNG
jgi:hypothetical protein